ncbi:MAG TPA: sigma-70 family RNA polymerase sigma factor [Phycisphaerae bacterium]|nr:sigma-70 family RNA polymerase sigma factor [Phycisphaerae bacterium]
MTSTPEQPLDLHRLRQQDEREFAAFVAAHQHLVAGLGQAMGLSGADCDDLAAETFAMAYRALPNFRGESELSTWLYRIAYRTAIKIRRRYPATPEFPDREFANADEPGPAQVTESAETNEMIWKAVARLDPDQAIAIELFYRRGLAVDEVAKMMEKPSGTVKTLLFRGRERLKMLLKTLEKTS